MWPNTYSISPLEDIKHVLAAQTDPDAIKFWEAVLTQQLFG